MTVVLVLIGGAIGAPVRYLTDMFVQSRHDSAFPWGTFTVNVSGSLGLGAVASAVVATDAPTWLLTVVGTGFCGALTTFSTFGFEAVRLVEEGDLREAFFTVVGSLVVGFAACAAGWAVVSAVWG